ncbi:DUF3040 domain-containing protein [Kitasatospora sp. NPDC048722]|uniref:DUF3040 domain-containing protein n=1 Tax=Kitasatospora sp. NPDC048722 TaxID=3155639 RepID=UPI003407BEC8
MHGRTLSARERQALAEIEAGLRAADTRLDRELGTMRPRTTRRFTRVVRAAERVPVAALIVLVSVSFIFLRASLYDHSAVDLTVFGLVWVPALVLVPARVVARRRGKRRR